MQPGARVTSLFVFLVLRNSVKDVPAYEKIALPRNQLMNFSATTTLCLNEIRQVDTFSCKQLNNMKNDSRNIESCQVAGNVNLRQMGQSSLEHLYKLSSKTSETESKQASTSLESKIKEAPAHDPIPESLTFYHSMGFMP